MREKLMGVVRHPTRDKGQTLVLVALIMLGLLAAVGLAIDGGRLLLLRRDAQNTTDAAMLASTLALCSGGTENQILEAGYAVAAENGYYNDDTTEVVVRTPPLNAPPNICSECAVEVEIEREIEPYFIQVVYRGALRVSTHGVGSCNPDKPDGLANNNNNNNPPAGAIRPPIRGLFAGGGSCTPTIRWSGSGIDVTGGIHSDGGIEYGGGGNPNNFYGETSFCGSVSGNVTGGTWQPIWASPDYVPPTGGNPGTGGPPPVVCGASCVTGNNNNNNGNLPPGIPPGQGNVVVSQNPQNDPAYCAAPKTQTYPVEFDIAQYRPGGSKANAAGNYVNALDLITDAGQRNACASGQNGATAIIPNSAADGLYYSPCDLKVLNGFQGSVTLVAEGKILTEGGGHDMDAYIDGLLMFSNKDFTPTGTCSTNRVIEMNGNGSNYSGYIYGPYGQVRTQTSNATIEGCIFAETIEIAGSYTKIICDGEEIEVDTIDTINISQ